MGRLKGKIAELPGAPVASARFLRRDWPKMAPLSLSPTLKTVQTPEPWSRPLGPSFIARRAIADKSE